VPPASLGSRRRPRFPDGLDVGPREAVLLGSCQNEILVPMPELQVRIDVGGTKRDQNLHLAHMRLSSRMAAPVCNIMCYKWIMPYRELPEGVEVHYSYSGVPFFLLRGIEERFPARGHADSLLTGLSLWSVPFGFQDRRGGIAMSAVTIENIQSRIAPF